MSDEEIGALLAEFTSLERDVDWFGKQLRRLQTAHTKGQEVAREDWVDMVKDGIWLIDNRKVGIMERCAIRRVRRVSRKEVSSEKY